MTGAVQSKFCCHKLVNFFLANWLYRILISLYGNVHLNLYYMCDFFGDLRIFLLDTGKEALYHGSYFLAAEKKRYQKLENLNFRNPLKIAEKSK